MNKIKQTLFWCLAFTVFSVFQISNTYAQENITVKGTVVDETNEPLIGVSVGISGTAGGTRTDVNGNFQLVVPPKTKALKFSYIGFDAKTIPVSATMNVKLAAARNTLDDVVVTGYQTQKKKDITSAIANITTKDFNQGNVTNSILQIQGKVAGLSIVQSSGNPNDNPTIRLRGQTSLYGNQNPLIVVDGIQLESADKLSNIPPGDIASYDVLKDASATSIYGSRGANGVIIITTKRGVSGQPKVEYQGFASVDNQAKFRGLLTTEQWRAANPLLANGEYDNGGNTNWEKAIVRQAYTQSHTIGLSGGNKGFVYRGSANYINQDNIIINSGKEQIGIRFNAEQKAFNDKLVLQLGIANTITNRKNANAEPQQVNQRSPALSLLNPSGEGYNSFLTTNRLTNFVQRQAERTDKAKENYSQYFGSANLEILPGLKTGVAGTMTVFNTKQTIFNPVYRDIQNEGKINTNGSESYRGEINTTYQKSIGKHNFNILGIYEYNYFTNSSFNASGKNIEYEFFQNNVLQGATLLNSELSSEKAENKLISLLGRVNYNYDNRYYVTSSIRRDGSSKFGPNNRWANFIATNVAWRITQEAFMKDILWINDLKLRVGYGQTGNQDGLSEYQSNRLRKVTGRTNPGQPDEVINYDIAQNANADVQWETRNGRNVGLDFAFLNSRLSGDINYYNDITKKLLFEYESAFALPLPGDGGRPAGQYVLANVGELSNKGLELALNYKAIQKKDFTWTIGGQISGVRTKIEKLVDQSGKYTIPKRDINAGKQNFTDNEITFLSEGKVPFVIRVPNYLGLEPDGKQIIGTDTTYIDPSPRFNYGVSNSFTYKNWSLNFFVRGVSGVKIYNNNAQNVQTNALENMTNFGFNTTQAGLDANINDNIKASDKWIENGSFLRLDNATLGYTFNNIKNVSNLRLFVAANNLFVITKFSGLDPEIQNAGSFKQGQTNNYLNNEEGTPRTRSFTFGINASF